MYRRGHGVIYDVRQGCGELLEEGLQTFRLEDRRFAAGRTDETLSLEVAEGTDGRLVRRPGDLGQFLACERNRGAKFLRQREEDLGETSFGWFIDHATFMLHLTKAITEETQGLLGKSW